MLSKFLDTLVNIPVWDNGFQMDVLWNTPYSIYYNNQELTHECYCPWWEIHLSWLDNMKIKDHIIDESPSQKLCHTKKFNNPKQVLGH